MKSDLRAMQAAAKIPTIVLGGTGYVAGDLLRLIASHPQLELKGVLSDSQPGEPLAKSFVHLAPVYPELKFTDLETITKLATSLPQSAIVSAAPHGVAAKLIDDLLTAAEAKGAAPRVIWKVVELTGRISVSSGSLNRTGLNRIVESHRSIVQRCSTPKRCAFRGSGMSTKPESDRSRRSTS